MGIKIILGLQWGDEGKGKIIDLLSSEVKTVVRAQGGNNAGHSVRVGQNEYKFHLVPSAILYPNVLCCLGSGTVIDLEGLSKEMDQLENQGVTFHNRFFISPFAHIVFDYHKILDQLFEKFRGENPIGTTGRGIGPCYVDRAARTGLRIGDMQDEKYFEEALRRVLARKNLEIEKFFEAPCLNVEKFIEKQLELAKKFKPFIYSFEGDLIEKEEGVLLEGAQGALLDLSFGTYPFVTSSHTISAGICLGAGVPPNKIGSVLGVIKAYTTRVGEGPFPTEFTQEDNQKFDYEVAREFGTTTGRKRRIGWFDAAMTNFAIKLNGVTELALTKLDILDSFENIKICVGYSLGGKILDRPFFSGSVKDKLVPVYETMPGWKTSTRGITEYVKLPDQAKAYVEKIQSLCKIRIKIVSTGPGREETIML